MSIGISSSCYYPQDTETALTTLGEAGINKTEIFFNSNYERTAPFVKKLKNITSHYGIEVVSLHPSLSFAEPYYFFSEYQRRFDEYREEFKLYHHAAAVLGAKYIILHGDRPCRISKISAEEYCSRIMKIAEDAKSAGVTLLQENVNNYRCADPSFIKTLRHLTDDKINFCLDIKQAIRAGFTVDQITEAMSGKIKHVHISDHTAEQDCVLPKNGKFDFKAFFEKMRLQENYSGDYMIEVYSNAYSHNSEIVESYHHLLCDFK